MTAEAPAQPAQPAQQRAPGSRYPNAGNANVGPHTAPREQYDIGVMCQVLRDTRGLVTTAARRLGCSPRTIDAYAERHPEVREALADARREILDLAEAKLLKAISDGEPWAISMVLKTLGKQRGYVERTEQSGPGGRPIQHQLSGPPVIREVVVNVPALGDARPEEFAPAPSPNTAQPDDYDAQDAQDGVIDGVAEVVG